VHINENNLDLIGKSFGLAPEQPSNFNKGGGPSRNRPIRQLKAPRNFTLLNFVGQLRDRNLVLDFALIDEPFVSQVCIFFPPHFALIFFIGNNHDEVQRRNFIQWFGWNTVLTTQRIDSTTPRRPYGRIFWH
jgi:hypothetical protein